MTKRREALSPHKALCDVAERIGWLRCAEVCGGVTVRTMQNWSDPDTSANVSIDNALKLDAEFVAAGGTHAPFACCFQAQTELITRIRVGAPERVKAAARVAMEAGQANAALIIASRPDASVADLDHAERETRELMAAACEALPGLMLDPKPSSPPASEEIDHA